jgi:Asp-tRNA(Asn)/Glu-tRNA(Gln) amidotransferase A subunit family amidase
MATMDDTGMPVGLTIVGRAYDDVAQLRLRPHLRQRAHGGRLRRVRRRSWTDLKVRL